MRNLFLFIVCFLFFINNAHSNSQLELTPAELLFNNSRDFSYSISPDGKSLAYLKLSARSTILHIVNLSKTDNVKTFNLGVESIYGLHWINNYRLLYNSEGRIKAVNTAGTESTTLIDFIYEDKNWKSYKRIKKNLRQWTVVDMLPDNDEEILVSGRNKDGYSSISKVNLYSGEREILADGTKYKINEWYVDKNGIVQLAVRFKKGKVTQYKVTYEGDKKIILSQISIGEYSLNYDGHSYINQRVFFKGFSEDGSSIYLSENIDKDKFQIIEYSLKNSTFVRTIASDNDFDIGFEDDESYYQSSLIFDRYNKKLVGIRFDGEKLITRWLEQDLAEIQKRIDALSPESVNMIVDWDRKKGVFVLHSIRFDSPSFTQIFRVKENTLEPILKTEGVDVSFGKSQFVTYKARDGYLLPAYYTEPVGIFDKEYRPPLVVLPHGGPWARDSWGYSPYVQFFSTRGYAVLQPQFRGSSGFGRGHLLSAKKNLSGLMIDDIADGASWLIESGKVDKNNVFIFGISYGGFAAILSSVRYGNIYKAAASLSSPLDVIQQIKDYRKNDNYFAYEYWKSLAGDPSEEKKFLKESSPIEQISNVAIPLQIFMGENDPIVDISQLRKFDKALNKTKSKYIKTQSFKNEGHGLNITANNVYMLEKIRKLFSVIKSN